MMYQFFLYAGTGSDCVHLSFPASSFLPGSVMLSFLSAKSILCNIKGLHPVSIDVGWPTIGLPIARDLISRCPDECFLDKTAAAQAVTGNSPAFLKAGILVNSVHAVVLLVDADVLLHTTSCKAEAAVPTCFNPATLVAVVPTTMVFDRNKRNRRGPIESRLLDNCLLEDQVYTSIVIGAIALATASSASFANVLGETGELESWDVCS